VKYTPQWEWLREELKRVDREKTPWLIVLMHIPIYNSNEAHFMEGESMRAVFEKWFVRYKVDVVFAGHVHAYERSVCFFPHMFFPLFYNLVANVCMLRSQKKKILKETVWWFIQNPINF
jgi:3',5'-cyclic AMP phosphodiesterase CpdA